LEVTEDGNVPCTGKSANYHLNMVIDGSRVEIIATYNKYINYRLK